MAQEHKSSWALIIICIVVILFGLFWITQVPTSYPIIQPVTPAPKDSISIEQTSDLEMAASAIELIDYSDAF